MKESRIPKTLDNPPRAGGMPLDSVLIGAVIWLLLFLFDMSFWGMGVGILSGLIYQRFKKRSFIRRLARMIYWYFPNTLNPMKQGAKGYERELKVKKAQDDK